MPENAAWAMVKPAGLKYPHKSFYPFPAKKRPASTTFGGTVLTSVTAIVGIIPYLAAQPIPMSSEISQKEIKAIKYGIE